MVGLGELGVFYCLIGSSFWARYSIERMYESRRCFDPGREVRSRPLQATSAKKGRPSCVAQGGKAVGEVWGSPRAGGLGPKRL